MLKYLINYDIETEIKNEDIMTEYEIDINDRMILQEQINNIRKTYFRLIKLFDELQANLVSFESEKDKKTAYYLTKFSNRNERIENQSNDIELLDINTKITATKEAMKTVSNQIDFVKSDLRFLSNSMYNKQ